LAEIGVSPLTIFRVDPKRSSEHLLLRAATDRGARAAGQRALRLGRFAYISACRTRRRTGSGARSRHARV